MFYDGADVNGKTHVDYLMFPNLGRSPHPRMQGNKSYTRIEPNVSSSRLDL